MDPTTIGAVLALVGVLSASVVGYLGKRGENANARLNSEMDQIQEERDGLRTQLGERDRRIEELLVRLGERDARIEELLEQRLADREENARLRIRIVELRGDPS